MHMEMVAVMLYDGDEMVVVMLYDGDDGFGAMSFVHDGDDMMMTSPC